MEWLFVYQYIFQVYYLALTSKFYFAKITPYIFRNVDDWTRRKL